MFCMPPPHLRASRNTYYLLNCMHGSDTHSNTMWHYATMNPVCSRREEESFCNQGCTEKVPLVVLQDSVTQRTTTTDFSGGAIPLFLREGDCTLCVRPGMVQCVLLCLHV